MLLILQFDVGRHDLMPPRLSILHMFSIVPNGGVRSHRPTAGSPITQRTVPRVTVFSHFGLDFLFADCVTVVSSIILTLIEKHLMCCFSS